LRKEVRPGEVDGSHMDEMLKMRRKEILASQRLSEREVQRERSPEVGGK
jgi:hypothetical protein